jgi:hypothetical protein
MDVKKGLDASNSSAIERVVQWAREEALHKVESMHPGEAHQQRDSGQPIPGGHPCQKGWAWNTWPPPQPEFDEDFIACVNRCIQLLHIGISAFE